MTNVVWLGDKEVKTTTISLSTNFINVQVGYVNVIHYFLRKACMSNDLKMKKT